MSEAPQWYQFTIARMLHATFWFAVTAVFIGAAFHTPATLPRVPPSSAGWIILELCAAALTFGGAFGALFGKPIVGASVAATLLVTLFLLILP